MEGVRGAHSKLIPSVLLSDRDSLGVRTGPEDRPPILAILTGGVGTSSLGLKDWPTPQNFSTCQIWQTSTWLSVPARHLHKTAVGGLTELQEYEGYMVGEASEQERARRKGLKSVREMRLC